MKIVVGIDVSKETLDVCLVSDDLKKPVHFKVKNTQAGFSSLLARCKSLSASASFHFCMESTGGYEFDLASHLASEGEVVSVLNPARVKRYIESRGWMNKTDKADARSIAEFARSLSPRVWHLSDPLRREICNLLRQRMSLGEEMRRVHNWLEHVHHKSEFQAAQERALLAFIELQITAAEGEITRLIESSESVKAEVDALTRIRGVGFQLALTLLCEMAPIEDYDSAQQFAAHAGLAPCRRESGSMEFKTRISKAGNARVRQVAWMPALLAMKHNPQVSSLAKRLEAKGLKPKQIRVACMRKLIMLAYGVLKALRNGNIPFYDSPDETEQPKPAKRVSRPSMSRLRARAERKPESDVDPLEHRHLGWRCKVALKKKLAKEAPKAT